MTDPLDKSILTQAEYFKDIVGTIREPLLVLDADLRVLAANRSFYKFFKVKTGETIGRLVYDLGDRQWDIPGLRLLLETILPKKAIFNDYHMEHDFPVIGRRILLLNARRVRRLLDKSQWILLAFEDITERMEMERSLQASEQQFHAVFETASDSMLLVDKITGQVLDSNRAAQDSLGYSKRALQKKNLWELGILKDRRQFRRISIELEKQGVVGLVGTTIPSSQGGDYPADITIMQRSEVIQCNIRDVTERKQAEEDTRSLARFPAENPNPVLRIARGGNLLYANEAALVQLADWKLEVGRPVPNELNDPIQEVLKKGTAKTVEMIVGKCLFSIAIQHTSGENDISIYGLDITERKRAEQALAESAIKFKWLYEYAPVAYHIISPEGTITDVNHRWSELLGFRREEAIGKAIFDFMVEEEREAAKASFEKKKSRKVANIEGGERNYRTKEGAVKTVKTYDFFALNESQNITSIQTTIDDITERKQAEEQIRRLNTELEATVEKRTAQLREALELNQKMIETSSLGIFACRADGPCVIANPAIARISGAPLEKMLQLNFREMESWKKNGLFDKAEAALATGKEQRAESHLTTTFGRDAWLNYYFTTFTSNDALHFLMMVEDITERKMADQALQQRTAQLEAANKELEAFSYSVSHDLRSPLRAIDGFSRILIEEYAAQLPAESRRYLDLVRSNTQKMGELVDDLLAFSRLGRQPLKKQTMSPEAIVRESLEDLRIEQAGRQIEIVIGDPSAGPGHALPDCEADPALLKQVFVNLLSNALKFTRRRQVARIEIGFEKKDGRRAYYVRDNGVGFDMQYVGKLFAVFQRLHRAEDYEGTGVGLAIVQRIVNRHGGHAWAEAEVDKGATFYFTLEGGESNESE